MKTLVMDSIGAVDDEAKEEDDDDDTDEDEDEDEDVVEGGLAMASASAVGESAGVGLPDRSEREEKRAA